MRQPGKYRRCLEIGRAKVPITCFCEGAGKGREEFVMEQIGIDVTWMLGTGGGCVLCHMKRDCLWEPAVDELLRCRRNRAILCVLDVFFPLAAVEDETVPWLTVAL